MKRVCLFIVFVLFTFGIILPVNAETFETGALISTNTVATVTTETFKYDFIGVPVLNDKGLSTINFSNITNLTNSKVPVSINVLLFDSEKKNIGFLTYCSEKDISSDYSKFYLNAGASTSYYINVVSRYFVEGKTNNDVSYMAVLDDNKYCHIGGYSKYAGLTIEQINSGNYISTDDGVKFSRNILENYLIMVLAIGLFIGIGVLFIFGLIINTLHRKIYNHGSAMSFLPITNVYLCVKVAFGSIVSKIYICVFLLSLVMASKLPIFSFIVSCFFGVSFLVVIFKLITKNYTLFIGEGNNTSSILKPTSNKKIEVLEEQAPEQPVVPTVEQIIAENKEEALDLSFGNGNLNSNSSTDVVSSESSSELDDLFTGGSLTNESTNTTSSDDFIDINPPSDSNDSSGNSFINFNSNNIDDNTTNNNSNNNKDGESELSKFFE